MYRLTTKPNLMILALLVAGCVSPSDNYIPVDPGDDPFADDDDDDADVVLFDNVLIGDEDPCLVGVDFTEDREVITFSFTCDPNGRGYEPGVIVVGSHNGGYLRKISSVLIEEQTITAVTEFASLSEVISEADLSETIAMPVEDRNLLNFGGTHLWSGDVGPSAVSVTLTEGSFDIDPALVIDGHWAEGSMQTIDFDLGLDLDMALGLNVSSTNGLRFSRSQTLWTQNWPFTFAVGPVPVVGVVEMKLSVGFSADAPGQATVSVGANADVSLHNRKSWRKEDGWKDNDVSEGSTEFQGPELDISTRAKVRAYARFDTTVKFYGTVGPRFRMEAGAQVTAEPSCDGLEYESKADIGGSGTITLSILDHFAPSKTFVKVTFTADLAEGVIPWPIDVSNFCDPETIMCGETVAGDSREGTGLLSGYSCNVGNYSAPEVVYQWKATKSGPTTLELVDPEPNLVNHDLFVVKGLPSLAVSACETWGLNSVEFEAEAGETYYLVVDGYHQDAGGFQVKLDCEDDNPFSGSGDSSNPF